MKIAIIGAGFAGLAAAHYAKEKGEVTVFASKPGASAIAAGLLHKFVGMHAKKNLYADEAFNLALELIDAKTKTGLHRIAANDEQAVWFRKAALDYPEEVHLVDEKTIWIPDAWVVDTKAYLSRLNPVEKTIGTLDELDDFDKIILCIGASNQFYDITPVRGQLLEVSGTPYPTAPISGQIYVIPQKNYMIVGATYERGPHIQNAEETLLPKLRALLPHFKLEQVLSVKSAVRASTPDHMPFIRQINTKTWALAGFGSKGLLYHAYYAKQLSKAL